MHNKMEDEINYLWFKSVHNEVFTRCWGSYNEMVSEGTVKAGSANSAGEKQEFDQPNEGEQAATPKKKARPSPEATGSNKKPKKGATTLRTIVADAQATKKNAESAMMKARGLLKQIDSNEVYMNAKGKEENEIKSALELLDEAVMNDFMDITTSEIATLVKETPEHVLQARLSQYSDCISALVKRLQLPCDLLTASVAARAKVMAARSR